MIADKAYSSIQISVVYDYNVNTAYFDGIQLFKEEFGTSYEYDENGNITSVTDLQKQKTTYTFEDNELTSMVLPSGVSYTYVYDDYHNVKTATTSMGQSYAFTYDVYGNNTKVTITAGGMSISSEAHYTSNGNYLDYTVDAIGNRTSDGYRSYTWEHGRQLASVINGDYTWQYKYNNDGMLIEQRDGNDVYTYVYNGTQLSQMSYVGSWEEYTMHFTYDANGTPLTVTFDYACFMDERTYDETAGAFLDDAEIDYTISDTYYYITNIQGDVIELLNADGESAGYYRYDAWGNIIDMLDNEDVIYYNPLRYRGYFRDPVTGYHYLQTRFYDPSVGRFISADAYVSTGQGILGNNMFAYCGNNPVLNVDMQGTRYCEATTVQGESAIGRSIACQHQNNMNMNRNIENVMNFWGVNSITDIPKLPDNAMLFMEDITSVTIGGVTYIHGRTIVMDNNKYCEYLFNGVGYGVSGLPFDACTTAGYVYGVSDVSDFEGWFYGGSFNQLYHISGGAIAPNGVYSKILSGNGFASTSIGGSITYYSTPQSRWKYGKANINWYNSIYHNTRWDSNLAGGVV